MNFRRIEVIFLITFIAIDIFLFGIFQGNLNNQATDSAKGDSNATIVKEMKNDQIKVGKLSNKNDYAYHLSGTQTNDLQSQMRQLVNQTPHYSGHEIQSEFRQPINLNKKHPQKAIMKLLQSPSFVIFGNQYHYNKRLSTKQDLVFNQSMDGRLIFSSEAQIDFTVNTNSQLVRYTQTHLSQITSLREKSETISEERAVIWLYQYNEIPNNAKVVWNQLSYTKLLTIDSDIVFVPTWVVAIKPENSNQIQIKRINAFTGGSVKENSNVTANLHG